MDLTASAGKHGIPPADIRHAVDFQLVHVIQEYGGERRMLILGPDRNGRILEIVAVPAVSPQLVIHADVARPKFLILLADWRMRWLT